METPLFQYLIEDAPEKRPQTVSELTAELRSAIERRFNSVWVEGEIVNFLAAGSGHWYFTLNDGTSQIKCVCWRGTNFRIRFKPSNGITVRIRGRLTFWEQKAELKLAVDSLDPSGEGALKAAFEEIRSRLEGEGMFAAEVKRPIPFFPRRVAVITSPTGAAYHDIHNTLTRRAKSVSLLLVAATVQGEGSAESIRRALQNLNRYNDGLTEPHKVDVVIVGRGGGSVEDLWAFNDELLARHIRKSRIPVISAVGHEIDWTISDLVADLRAATPTAAAELVAGREDDISTGLDAREGQLTSLMEYALLSLRNRTDQATNRMEVAFTSRAQSVRDKFAALNARMAPASLFTRTAAIDNRLQILDQRGDAASTALIVQKSERLKLQMARLDALSPLGVLTRGYSITQTADGHVVREASQVEPGDKLKIRLGRGKLDVEVLSSE